MLQQLLNMNISICYLLGTCAIHTARIQGIPSVIDSFEPFSYSLRFLQFPFKSCIDFVLIAVDNKFLFATASAAHSFIVVRTVTRIMSRK